MSGATQVLTVAAAVGCGLVGGVFLAFSTFVMAGLDRLPAAQGIEAMQSINRTAVTPPFMAALFGTAVLCLAVAIWAVGAWGDRRAALVLAGSVLYLVGVIGVTMAANVPRNDALAALDSAAPAAAAEWAGYVSGWTNWNHVRTLAGLAGSALLIAALTGE